MSSTIPLTGRRACTRSIQRPDRSVKADRFAPCFSTSVSNRPIWLVEAACPVTAWPPTTQRIAGSCASRSASLVSSYPAKRPNTDWRNCPTREWRPFAPVRVSVNTSPAVSLRPRVSSSSRQASRPPSDVTFGPWNSSLRRQSNASLRVHPGSFAGLTELSQHEADGREAQECERLAVQAFPIFSQSTASVEPCDGSFNNPALRQDGEPLCGIRTLHNLHVDLAHDRMHAAK